jgi:hypothetical protein
MGYTTKASDTDVIRDQDVLVFQELQDVTDSWVCLEVQLFGCDTHVLSSI